MASMKPLPETASQSPHRPGEADADERVLVSPDNDLAPAFAEHLPGQAITNSTGQRCDHAQRLQLDAATARDPPIWPVAAIKKQKPNGTQIGVF
jgi:hypothetical protein